MAVILAKKPSEHEVLCDLHGALTNLGWILQDEKTAACLYDRLQRTVYGDVLFLRSKVWLAEFEKQHPPPSEPHADWAYHYFIASWMGRNGVSGTARVNYQIATRWTHGGGSGPGRFRAATESIPEWHDRIRNAHILRRSMFDVLPKLQDHSELAIYADPPYLAETVAGNSRYLCDFTPADHQALAECLNRFKSARVAVSYYAHPKLNDLYPGWTWLDCSRHKHLHVQNKRGTARKSAPEVLLLNGPAVESEGVRLAQPEILFEAEAV